VRVRISANGTSWISITDATNHQLFQGLVNAGDVKDFRDPKRLNLVIGNAGAIDLVVNGRDLGSPGTSGQVVRLSFRPGDPQGSPG
jgi:hypothetical protein